MDEMRVSVVPSGVEALVSAGHRVLIERNAGSGAGFLDQAYEQAGAELMLDGQAVWGQADLIVKVKEPLPLEYGLMRAEQTIFTFLHLAAAPELAVALASKKAVAVAYETIQQTDRSLPLLEPMSEIAGKMSIQVGASF
ncbi:alanine dehydrogenase [Candidatus Hakubella thermalkaliphila]|uniref:Alanine dehydrogenase n=2 Tax=Candidatus Hakubella thermalkaliphila TaxID=2754717 RepID=A0A6V8NIW3_9ACTN|nr:alanine dehydrogenase [Candidatus Hakubella thermalkaliphila]